MKQVNVNNVRLNLLVDQSRAILHSLAQELNDSFTVYDAQKHFLFGNTFISSGDHYLISVQDQKLGSVYGDKSAAIVADLLSLLAKQVVRSRHLGGEALEMHKALNLLYNMSEQFGHCMTIDQVAGVTIDYLHEFANANSCSFLLSQPETNYFKVILGSELGADSFHEPRFVRNIDSILKIDEGIAGAVMNSRQGEYINNIHHDPRYAIPDYSVYAIICVPLKTRQSIFGVLNASNKQEIPFTEQQFILANTIASQAAIAMENVWLHQGKIDPLHTL